MASAASASNEPKQGVVQIEEAPIKNIAIVGAGIAGLSLAHALSASSGISCHIFDQRKVLDYSAGAGIQINGGMSVLHKIDPELHQKVADASLPITKIRSRAKPREWSYPWEDAFLKSKIGHDNIQAGYQTLLEMDLREAVKTEGGDTEKDLIINGQLQCYSIMRGALQRVLVENLPDKTSLELDSTLTGLEVGDGGIICRFQNGKITGPFDMVIGSDGIKSAVKEFIDTGKIGEDSKQRGGAIYSGIRIQYAVADEKGSSSSAELRQYFGNGAYALSGTYGNGANDPTTRMVAVVRRDEDYIGPFKKKSTKENQARVSENSDWEQDNRIDSSDPRNECLGRLKAASIPLDEVGDVVSESSRFFELGVYFHNPFSFRGWKRQIGRRNFCVLIGDSAHAMPPFLGQGANQAIQDAFSLARTIEEHNEFVKTGQFIRLDEEKTPKSLNDRLQEYETKRWFPTTSISLKAAFLGYLETGGHRFISEFRDWFFFTAGKLGIARKVFLDGATPKV